MEGLTCGNCEHHNKCEEEYARKTGEACEEHILAPGYEERDFMTPDELEDKYPFAPELYEKD